MTARRWTPTGPAPRRRAAWPRGSGRSTASPVPGAGVGGVVPRSDAELLPLLLDLIGGLIPVDAWPTQMSRQQRTAHARETAQADQAAADRPARADRKST